MRENLDRSVWINYFHEFTRRNYSRPTRLEVFGENGAQVEECGLPFAGISLARGNGAPDVEIILGGNPVEPRRLTHVVAHVQDITPKRGPDGRDEALAIVDAQGETSLLRFEPKPDEWSFCKSPFSLLSSITLPQSTDMAVRKGESAVRSRSTLNLRGASGFPPGPAIGSNLPHSSRQQRSFPTTARVFRGWRDFCD
jgi:hypothetical protein